MEKKIFLNDNWGFSETFADEMIQRDYDQKSLETVRLPHTNKVTDFHYFDEHEYQMICGYRKVFTADSEWKGKHVLLTFEGAAHEAYVFLNGKKIATHACGYTAFTVDIARYLSFDEENVLVVKLNSHENLNIPPFGYVIDYMTYGGLYREVYLEIKDSVYVEDVFVTTQKVLAKKKELNVVLTIAGKLTGTIAKLYLRKYDTENTKKEERRFLCEQSVYGNQETISVQVENVDVWDLEHPNLYFLDVELVKDNKIIDLASVRFGFRESVFKKDGFYLNGEKVKITGINRHQSYPYVGYAMPKSPQQRDADLIKMELGLNAVRTSHYPQSQYFIDRCDEIGLLVFTELPGWQNIGNHAWKNAACKMVEEMVLQYRNHPSIILWGVRINESKDDDEFYTRTNQIAHELDPSRQTGGVRCIKKSHLLEDVYTYNDFIHDGKSKGVERKKDVTSNNHAPYFISEYNGHMYPTKNFDCEEHRLTHALRHATVLNAINEQTDIAGGFAWCMFDYNTHKDFGSGDRICYHGVMDMFRNPKLAAAVYMSQSDVKPVLEISSSMDIGEHPAGCKGDVYMFTNADTIRVYKNGMFLKEYDHSNSKFKFLKNGPIVLDDVIGTQLEEKEGYSKKKAEGIKKILMAASTYGPTRLPFKIKLLVAKMVLFHGMRPSDGYDLFSKYIGDWGGQTTTYRFEAIKDGKVVKVVDKGPMMKVKVVVDIDHTDLTEDSTYDVACVRIKACDEQGNVLNYYQEPFVLEAEGNIEVIGPKLVSFKGGMAGTYVKTVGKSGTGKLIIRREGHEALEYGFTIKTK